MRYGFKAEAERISASLRADVNITLSEKIDAKHFLRERGIIIWTPQDVPGVAEKSLKQLLENDPDSWSGITIKEGETHLVIINPTHPKTRLENTLMHEWSHTYLKHKPKRIDISETGLILISDYEKEFEDEADWLAGAMLVPRDGLLAHRKSGKTPQQIADIYGVSKELLNWRLRMTGIERQLKSFKNY
jgi:Zn-dependent peptidase ImmA (M78 family)